MKNTFSVIVVGAGHAGIEAAAAAARSGASCLLLTQNIDTIGQMSCNPAIGGIGKGHLVKEIDALGGIMARAIDRAGIQFRILNARKGPAVRATRAQADRTLYKLAVRELLEELPTLQIFQGSVGDLLVADNAVAGVRLENGQEFRARAVVLTTGTFLAGRIHIGDQSVPAGRAGDAPANALAERLRALQFPVGRLKTGTPPRIDGRSIDYSVLEMQPGDDPAPPFSFLTDHIEVEQRPCYITYTNAETHRIIADNLQHSAMYGGHIQSKGPRYCPSIEDKIVRFADKAAHQIFLEPEGLRTHEVYPNGISTSLPFPVQEALVRSMQGLENAILLRPGYAIEYDYLDPRALTPQLQSQLLPGLFCAGQINGTTGYEEAAAQGLLAGINAARWVRGEAGWCPGRHEAYLGVMVDDLVTRGLDEPYRMFTSRRVSPTPARRQCRPAPDAGRTRAGLGRREALAVLPGETVLAAGRAAALGKHPHQCGFGSGTAVDGASAAAATTRPQSVGIVAAARDRICRSPCRLCGCGAAAPQLGGGVGNRLQICRLCAAPSGRGGAQPALGGDGDSGRPRLRSDCWPFHGGAAAIAAATTGHGGGGKSDPWHYAGGGFASADSRETSPLGRSELNAGVGFERWRGTAPSPGSRVAGNAIGRTA